MSRRRYEALLSLGSNVDPDIHVPRVLAWLRARFEVVSVSPAYRVPAVGGGPGQPDFVNLAVRIRTDLPPRALREATRRAEDACGRRRTADRHAPRTMDVDVVLFDAVVEDYGAWRLPDPQLRTEAFVLVPCADAAPDAVEPETGLTLRRLRDRLPVAERRLLVRLDARSDA